jgi:hypothetical protein
MKLVGREAELATIREACLRARDGRGQVIVVSGEPGLGKTALVETIASELGGAFDVTWARASLTDAPYSALLPAFGVEMDPARSEFELWERVLEAVVRASTQRPVMWAIDDLHLADAETLDLLCFVAHTIRALPIVLIATTRAAELDDGVQQRITRLARNAQEVRLQAVAGLVATANVSMPVAARVVATRDSTSDAARTALGELVDAIFAAGELGDFAAQDRHVDQMLQLAARVGDPRLTWRALLVGSMRAVARGQFSESDRFITEVERALLLTDDPSLALSLARHRHHRALDLHRETTVGNSLVQLEPMLAALPDGNLIVALERGLAASRFGDAAGAKRALTGLSLEQSSTAQLGIVGEICAAGGSDEQRRTLLEQLSRTPDRHIYFDHASMSYCGPMGRVLGLLELSLGNRNAGEQHLRRALDLSRSLGLATWVARIAFELGDHAEAGRLATNLGMRGLAKRAHAPLVEVAPATRPSLGMWREVDVWRISYGVRIARIADSRGMQLIAKLVERPGEEMHVLVLAGGEALAATSDSLSERARVTVQDRIKESLVRIGQHDNVIADYLRAAIRTGTYCTFRP